MAGFIDKNTRVMDVVLTSYGKKLLSQGRLSFVYYSFSDDQVDYDPYIAESGSMTMAQLTSSKIDSIVEVPTMEPIVGLVDGKNDVCLDMTNVQSHLFTVSQGQKIVPEIRMDPNILSGSVRINQRKIVDVYSKIDENGHVVEKIEYDRGYERFGATNETISFSIDDLEEIYSEGFLVNAFMSGSPTFQSHGYSEVLSKRDNDGIVSYDDELRLFRRGDRR